MKKLNNTEAKIKRSAAYKKKLVNQPPYEHKAAIVTSCFNKKYCRERSFNFKFPRLYLVGRPGISKNVLLI